MSSGFITETEIEEAKKKRQEEWERVRNPDEPLEAPEEAPYDSRSLYERLQEQKQKKDLEYEEAHKLKNMIKGLDDDEIEFLDLVDRSKLEADRKKSMEEEKELLDYRTRVANLQEQNLDQRLQAEININKPKTVSNSRTSQVQLLKGVVVKRSSNKRKHSESEESCDNTFEKQSSTTEKNGNSGPNETEECADIEGKQVPKRQSAVNTGLRCIGILPGLGCYSDSSSDECSSDDSDAPCEKISASDKSQSKAIKK